MTHIRFIYSVILPLLILTMVSASAHATTTPQPEADMLGYINHNGSLMLYNPVTRTREFIADNVTPVYALARNGRVAFVEENSNFDFEVANPYTDELMSVNFPDNTMTIYPTRWSHDGQYLLVIATDLEQQQTLYIWDGHQFINLLPDIQGFVSLEEATWRDDGLLAFSTRRYDNRINSRVAQLFLWDGHTTAVMASSTTDKRIHKVRWNTAGQLLFEESYSYAFYEQYASDADITTIMWDGISYVDGIPDRDSFISIHRTVSWSTQADVVVYTEYPDDHINSLEDTRIIWWNMQTQTIVQESIFSNETTAPHNPYYTVIDGTDLVTRGFPSITLSRSLQIRTLENETIFNNQIHASRWSPDGYLVYCDYVNRRLNLLTIWDGEESWLVASIPQGETVRLQSGARLSCYSG